GPSTNADLIGTYTANDNPGVVAASQDNDSHCLTVVLDVDGSYSPLSGFGADISCVDLCMPFTPHIDNVEGAYYENGVYNFGFNVPVTFTASADFPEGGESPDISYHWDFGNG